MISERVGIVACGAAGVVDYPVTFSHSEGYVSASFSFFRRSFCVNFSIDGGGFIVFADAMLFLGRRKLWRFARRRQNGSYE